MIDKPYTVIHLGWAGANPVTFHATLEEARAHATNCCTANGGRYLVAEALGVVAPTLVTPVWTGRARELDAGADDEAKAEVKVDSPAEPVKKPESAAPPAQQPPRMTTAERDALATVPRSQPLDFEAKTVTAPAASSATDADAPPWTPRPLPEGDGKPRYAEVRGVKLPPDVLRRMEDVGVGLGAPAPELLREVEEMFVAAHSNPAKTIMTWTGYPLTDVNHATLVAVKDIIANFIKK